MASQRREIPDSEDEPMTSSPVNTWDGAADKLFATSRGPLQDAQDALQEATDTHQATADTVANLPGNRPEGLDDDQHDASLDDNASKPVQNDMQPDTTTSSHQQLTEATSSTAHPLISEDASSPDVGTVHMDGQQKAERESTHEPNAATTSDTNFTPHAPKAIPPSEQTSDRDKSELAPHDVASEHIKQQFPSEAALDARQLVDCGGEQLVADETATGSSSDQRDDSIAHAESLDGDIGAKHAILPQGAHSYSYTEATVVAPSDSAQNQTGESASENKSSINTVNQGVTSAGSAASESTIQPLADTSTNQHRESTPNTELPPPASAASSASPQGQTTSDFVISKPAEEPVPSPETSFVQTSGRKGDLAGHEEKVESFDTVMDVETSHLDSMTETQTTRNDDMTSSSHSTSNLTNASTPEEAAGGINVDIADNTTATNSQETQLVVDPSTTTPTSTSTSTTQPLDTIQPPATLEPSTVAKTPQEITLAELKAQKSAMLASLAALPAIQILMEEHAHSDTNTSDNDDNNNDDEPTETDVMIAANKIVKDHIKLLHEYNELKDVGQGLMGLIADQRGVRIVEVQEEFGIEAGD